MIGEPDAGNPHVRFDEGVQETCFMRRACALLYRSPWLSKAGSGPCSLVFSAADEEGSCQLPDPGSDGISLYRSYEKTRLRKKPRISTDGFLSKRKRSVVPLIFGRKRGLEEVIAEHRVMKNYLPG
jgi:hypothetical protein